MSRPTRLRLFDMLNAIAQIDGIRATCIGESRETSSVEQLAIERCLEIISEASRHLPEEDKVLNANVDWRGLANLGNVLRHDYQRADQAVLKLAIERDLPLLRSVTETLYQKHKLPADPWPDGHRG